MIFFIITEPRGRALARAHTLPCMFPLNSTTDSYPRLLPKLPSQLIPCIPSPLNPNSFQGRYWLLRVLGRIVLAPLFTVKFEDFFIADQLVSLAPVLVDTYYFFCYVGTDLVRIAVIPSWTWIV